MTEDRAPEEAGPPDERDEYESPEIVVLGSVEDLTAGMTVGATDSVQGASLIPF